MSNSFKKKYLVSACLAGIECRYDCQAQERIDIVELVNKGEAFPVCPEQLGGLPTPRDPAEIQSDGRVLSNKGEDVTQQYNEGARLALEEFISKGASEALLKSKSPMCGVGKIYDGKFSGKLISGNGIFTQLLIKKGVTCTPID
ncbi:MAG: DUF523 domain-containing protein [Oligoflexia bacterium]|nr:DUF523 domain-containing protein [Oligoflexia bacterium]